MYVDGDGFDEVSMSTEYEHSWKMNEYTLKGDHFEFHLPTIDFWFLDAMLGFGGVI